jgi:hypothetical protein
VFAIAHQISLRGYQVSPPPTSACLSVCLLPPRPPHLPPSLPSPCSPRRLLALSLLVPRHPLSPRSIRCPALPHASCLTCLPCVTHLPFGFHFMRPALHTFGIASLVTSRCQRAGHPRQSQPEARVSKGSPPQPTHRQNQGIKGQPTPDIRSPKPRCQRAAHLSPSTTGNGGQGLDQEQSPGNGRSPTTGGHPPQLTGRGRGTGDWLGDRWPRPVTGKWEVHERSSAKGGDSPQAVTRHGRSPATGGHPRPQLGCQRAGHPSPITAKSRVSNGSLPQTIKARSQGVTCHNRPAAEMVSGSRGHGRSPGNGRSSPWAVTRHGRSPTTGAGTRHGRLLATRGHPPRAVTRHGWPARGFFDFLSFS